MKLNRFLLVLGLTAIGLTTASKKASALTWTIGNYTDTGYSLSGGVNFGQSFDPSVAGDSGSGTPSSAVSITNWSFYSNAAPTSNGNLYIFSNPYTGNATALNSTTTNLIGKSNTGVYNAGNQSYSYDFGSGLDLGNSGKYYAYSDAVFPVSSFQYFASTNTYDSSTLGRWTASSSSPSFQNQETSFDARFQATFTGTTQAVPFEFNPTEGIALGLPLFMGLRMLKKRKALKNSTREEHDLTSVR